MGILRKMLVGLGFMLVVSLSGLTIAMSLGVFSKSSGKANAAGIDEDDEADELIPIVHASHPRVDPSFIISVQQLCDVEAFFETELRSRVAGSVKRVQKDLNSRVRQDEVLIELDVPELVQEVQQREAVIFQRRQELLLAHARVKTARVMIDVAKASIDVRKAELSQAQETCILRESRWNRMVKLKKDIIVDEAVVDEFRRDFKSAESGCEAARSAIRKAEADLAEKESNLEMALVDVHLKEAAIVAAEKDRDHSQAMLDYAWIRAPFDGVVTQRKANVGHFVTNSTATENSGPLMTIARDDLVTIVMKVPDTAAPFVRTETEAIVQIHELPGVLLRGRVTRYAPSIQSKDRTMRVEVDFFNGSERDYQQFKSRIVAGCLSPLGHPEVLTATALMAASREKWSENVKSEKDPFPLLPEGLTKLSSAQRLVPGMSGYMRLNLDHFKDAHLIPSAAVFSLAGKPYILEVRDNVSHRVPVHVQMNDGRLAKVIMVEREANPIHGEPEVLKELTGDEWIVLSRQVEIGDGKTVKVSEEPW